MRAPSWPAPRSRRTLSKSPTETADLWLVDSRTIGDDQLARRAGWLGAAEQARYARFVRPARQRQFLTGRILLRTALGQLLGVAPASISLAERENNAPLLEWAGAMPGFSLSHSGPWVACAVSAGGALGLDIEVRDPGRDLLALAAQAFSADETARIAALSGEARVAAFYEQWSTTEAKYKLASDCAACISIPHPDLSIVLCSASPLAPNAVRRQPTACKK